MKFEAWRNSSDPHREQPRQTREPLVLVQREWNGWHSAMVRAADLEGVHWCQPFGAPRPLLHAYVWCRKIVSGGIPHARHDSPCSERLKVCILKRHTLPLVFEMLSRRADAAEAPTAALSGRAG